MNQLLARRFTGPVPARSRYGNTLTRKAFSLTTGRSLRDTQTGLRGHPARTLAWLRSVSGDRFEYELRVLLQATREARRIDEVEIATIYLQQRTGSFQLSFLVCPIVMVLMGLGVWFFCPDHARKELDSIAT